MESITEATITDPELDGGHRDGDPNNIVTEHLDLPVAPTPGLEVSASARLN